MSEQFYRPDNPGGRSGTSTGGGRGVEPPAARPTGFVAPDPGRARARDNVVPFRHRGRTVRYRRAHPLVRMAKPFGGAVLLVGMPVAVAVWMLTTPRLALAALTVESEPSILGAVILPGSSDDRARVRRVNESWVQRSVRPRLGSNLLRLRLDDISRAVEAHPWVASVEVRKELPHRLRIRIQERTAAALFHDGDRLFYVDPIGVVIAPLESYDPAADLVVLSRAPQVVESEGSDIEEGRTNRRSKAAREAAQRRALAGGLGIIGELAAVRPDWASRLSEIEILGMDDYRLVIETIPFPLLVRAGTLKGRVRKLESLVSQIAARYGAVSAVDLRFARRIIVQPVDASALVRS